MGGNVPEMLGNFSVLEKTTRKGEIFQRWEREKASLQGGQKVFVEQGGEN